ncbi:class I SAM-dependent methyltransferase [Williamsia herbipolensis]|uniref:class I SAM-dependent methyltransferase n=1 Tax=Williamsia herbipolensis TaxID=1603258 RepID=UPI0005F81384|nr:class I SAM-dependent methyltransferase [Williamsia herbipolensis]
MRDGQPSATAFGAARHRAVHQDLDGGVVFSDPLAWAILGVDDRARIVESARAGSRHGLRWFIAARHRFAEDRARIATTRGVRQVAVLGAGLDTFAYRQPDPAVTVFEVDHPATGKWKRERLRQAGIAIPASVRTIGVDFERDDLIAAMTVGGFAPDDAAVVMWLGVMPYLTPPAVATTLGAFGAMADCEIVFDYSAPITDPDAAALAAASDLRARTARVGEPLSDPVAPAELHRVLRTAGFTVIDDLDRPAIRRRILGLEPLGGSGGGHIISARTGEVSAKRP